MHLQTSTIFSSVKKKKGVQYFFQMVCDFSKVNCNVFKYCQATEEGPEEGQLKGVRRTVASQSFKEN